MTRGRSALWQGALRRLAGTAEWLTTPLLPDDYLTLLNPLWAAREPRARVEAVRPETAEAATIVLRPGRHWRPHRPGQWTRIRVDIDGVRHWRTFSLSSPPRTDGLVTITVKAAGLVSGHLVRSLRPGTIVGLACPEGEFVLPDPPPARLLFLTAGSGITPVRAMLHGLPAEASDVVLIHSAPAREDVIFGVELRDLAARRPGLRLYERHTRYDGRLGPAGVADLCPDWAERTAFACGPAAMLAAAAEHWAAHRVPLRVERFHPVLRPPSGGDGGRVRFLRSGRETEADGRTPLLAAGEEAGALLPSGCRMGICRSCLGRLASGRVRDLRTGRLHGEVGDLIQTCVSAAAGTVEIDL
ncbi:ferredoxin reductase [Actinomadura sp. DC4]|uniref:ferredoxin reductase n=1 Tax=Actinomadura sp. DC4 TaxID=3055069 RepID=UPI0025B0EE58|nr:ferredoxin reductase [Actinomadura sp. DC4]MDN3351469.1 ferredoxin reductase [Actinomadura sp. DC4]